ncbi:MAG: hypothetical protein QG604_666 [Candidatus Dependentiae bacterium]|nr:hypothetical protein [Candidatus Dependentiae bacterium]
MHFGPNELKNGTACSKQRYERFWQKLGIVLRVAGCDSLANMEEFFKTHSEVEIERLLREASVAEEVVAELLIDWRPEEVE